MSYCLKADILEQVATADLIDLTDDAGAGIVDESAVTRAIDDADAEIDSYLGARYDLPLASTPNLVRKLSVDIAVYNLYSRRGDAVPENRKARYEAAILLLPGLRAGDVSLGASAPEASADAGPAATTYKADRVFTRGSGTDGTTGTLDTY